jgi:hypothetical protein
MMIIGGAIACAFAFLRGVLTGETGRIDRSPMSMGLITRRAIDKTRYSAFSGSALRRHLQDRDADGLIITGSETDVCVLATVLSAVDLGYRVKTGAKEVAV